MRQLRIATRRSPLALWQAEYVAQQLTARNPDLRVELVEITTSGDRLLGAPLASVGGKGLFMKELEVSLLEGRSDIAVHSMKDVVVTLPEGFTIAAVCERDDPLDAFVSHQYEGLEQMPNGSVVGTCSLRRQCQIRNAFSTLEVKDIRGSVNTRLSKLDKGEFDAIILAVAGLRRLGMADRIRKSISPDVSLPAVGQGAIGIECKEDDVEIIGLVQPLNHAATRDCIEAERAMNRKLDGGCQVPVGGFACLQDGELILRGLVGTPDGRTILKTEVRGEADQAENLGERAAGDLIELGAADILREVYRSHQT